MIELVPMALTHMPQVAAIEPLCFSVPWSLAQLTGELENPLAAYFVALEDEKVLGYIGSQTVLGEACVMNLAVHPEQQGRGLGALLMARLIDDCLAKACTLLTLEVRESNKPALAVYRSFGFEVLGKRKNYYTDPTEDALIMTRYFMSAPNIQAARLGANETKKENP